MNLMQRGILIAVAAAAYLVGFWPSWWVRDLVLRALNNPPYEGPWILIPHLFLYTTLQALFCLAAWSVLARLQWMPALRLSPRLPTRECQEFRVWGVVELLGSSSSFQYTMMRVGAVGNRVLCGFPSPCGRVLGVHRDGSVHALFRRACSCGRIEPARRGPFYGFGVVKRSSYRIAN